MPASSNRVPNARPPIDPAEPMRLENALQRVATKNETISAIGFASNRAHSNQQSACQRDGKALTSADHHDRGWITLLRVNKTSTSGTNDEVAVAQPGCLNGRRLSEHAPASTKQLKGSFELDACQRFSRRSPATNPPPSALVRRST